VTGWIVVGTLGAATMLLKAAGPMLLGGRELPERVARLLTLLAPALLAALIAVLVFGGDRRLVVDERLVGLGAAVVAAALRAPIIVVVVAAAVATALVRTL